MRQLVLLLFFAFVLLYRTNAQETVDDYIQTYQYIAVSEMERTGIPASVKLAQGLLESSWGQSELAQFSYNHFGIKCGKNWEGDGYYKVDDDLDEHGQLRESCFRVFESPEASYIAHSEFLLTNQRYSALFDLQPTNYKAWAKGLRKAGYATDPSYPSKIIKVIEKYDLSQYDFMASDEIELLAKANSSSSKNINDEAENTIEYASAEEAFMAESIEAVEQKTSKKSTSRSEKDKKSDFDQTTEKISKNISRFLAQASEKLDEDTKDFTKNFRKRKTKKRWQKESKEKETVLTYNVKKDETIAMIAHEHETTEEDIRLRNFLDLGDEVAEGETLYIRGERRGKKPKTLKLMVAPEDEYLFDTGKK